MRTYAQLIICVDLISTIYSSRFSNLVQGLMFESP